MGNIRLPSGGSVKYPTSPGRLRQLPTAIALLLALVGCGTTPRSSSSAPAGSAPGAVARSISGTPSIPAQAYPSGCPGVPRATRPATVDKRDPDAVARAALTAMYTSDTRIDTSPHDATVRATRYMIPAYAAELINATPHAAPGARWQDWADHHAYTTVTIVLAADAGRPPDTPTTGYRRYALSVTARGDSGYVDTEGTVTAFVTLTRTATDRLWQVAKVRIE